ncbi:MAG: bifunctional 4-hydroxy-2-oxoglutarate aldolase/2-dehydro-3-deoxy-phosphogluconate aldolase [bacterium]
MARFDRMAVLNAMIDSGLVPVFYTGNIEAAKKITAACAEGGVRLIEFTNRGEKALKIFEALSDFVESDYPSLILGAGSIMDAPTAALFIGNGSNFIVSPVLNAEIARLCNRRKIVYLPGCATASEISAAEELGVEIVKVFPGAQIGGPQFVKAVLAPMPWTRIMPTGGVDATRESILAWFEAGVACIGMGSGLIRKELLAAGDYQSISDDVKSVLEWIREARDGKR